MTARKMIKPAPNQIDMFPVADEQIRIEGEYKALKQISLVSRNTSLLRQVETNDEFPVERVTKYLPNIESNIDKRLDEAKVSFFNALSTTITGKQISFEDDPGLQEALKNRQWSNFMKKYQGPGNKIVRSERIKKLEKDAKTLRLPLPKVK